MRFLELGKFRRMEVASDWGGDGDGEDGVMGKDGGDGDTQCECT
jgi:hypothetical protein